MFIVIYFFPTYLFKIIYLELIQEVLVVIFFILQFRVLVYSLYHGDPQNLLRESKKTFFQILAIIFMFALVIVLNLNDIIKECNRLQAHIYVISPTGINSFVIIPNEGEVAYVSYYKMKDRFSYVSDEWIVTLGYPLDEEVLYYEWIDDYTVQFYYDKERHMSSSNKNYTLNFER